MVDESGVPPLPRRVPGASGSPRPPAPVELGVISEDLRQRVLTALASELEHDEAERRRDSGGSRAGASPASSTASLATGSGVSPANGSSANPGNGTSVSLDSGRGAAEDAAMAQEPEGTAERADAGDAAGGPGAASPRSAVRLPRRAPGANGAPPPPAELRRDYLPPSVFGRKLDPEEHTEPLPRISATGRGTDGPAATGTGQSAQSLFSPTPPTTAPPGASAEPAPPGTAPARSGVAGNGAAGKGPTAVRAISRGARGRGGTHDASGQRGAGGRDGTYDASGQRGAGGRVRGRAACRADRTCSDRA